MPALGLAVGLPFRKWISSGSSFKDFLKSCGGLVTADPAALNPANDGRPLLQRTVRRFNGTTQYATKAISNYRSGDASGAIEATFSTTDTGTQSFISSSSELVADKYISFGIREGGKIYIIGFDGSSNAVRTVNTFADGLTHTAKVTSNGTAWSIEVDGVAQTLEVFLGSNTGEWFSDVPDRDNLSVGVLKRSSSLLFFNGTISQISVYDPSGEVVNQWELVEKGGSIMRDALGVHDLTYINNPVFTTDKTAASDPLNERGFTEGTGSNGAAIGEYLVARLDNPAIDVGGNATQLVNTAYPVEVVKRQSNARAFNGVDQYATKAVSNYRSGDASGAIEVTFNTSSLNDQLLFSTSDESTTGHYFGVGVLNDGRVYIRHRETFSGNDQVATVDAFNDGLTHTARITSNGSFYTIEIDGVAVATTVLAGTNSGAWFSTMTELDNIVVGALKRTATIAYFDGTISDVRVYDPNGDVVGNYNLAEGTGTTAYDSSGDANHLTYINNPLNTLQDVKHSNLEEGFTLSGGVYIPAVNATTDALGNPLTNPATAGVHNGAETQYDFYNVATGGTTPAIVASGVVLTDYSFGQILLNPMFKRELSSVAEDRHTLFSEVLTGACLEKANGFFSLNYITDQAGNIQFDEQGNPQQEI